MSRDYDSAAVDALATLTAAATAEGEQAVGALAYALYAFARKLEKQREEMPSTVTTQCHDCGRHFAVTMTVKRERDWGAPENCPPCWNQGPNANGRTSCYTSTFLYVDAPPESGRPARGSRSGEDNGDRKPHSIPASESLRRASVAECASFTVGNTLERGVMSKSAVNRRKETATDARKVRALIGRKIIGVEPRASIEGDAPCDVWMHDWTLILDNGARVCFITEEHPDGGEYGVNLIVTGVRP